LGLLCFAAERFSPLYSCAVLGAKLSPLCLLAKFFPQQRLQLPNNPDSRFFTAAQILYSD
jgi:hypothetical protein